MDTLAPPMSTIRRSPACDMAQYATYPTGFAVASGTTLMCTAGNEDEIREKALTWGRDRDHSIIEYPLAPFRLSPTDALRGVGTAVTPGGNWSGTCGSTVWVPEPDEAVVHAIKVMRALGDRDASFQHGRPQNHRALMSQAWLLNGAAKASAAPGIYLECTQRYRHLGECGHDNALDLSWNWRDYAPYDSAREQLVLF